MNMRSSAITVILVGTLVLSLPGAGKDPAVTSSWAATAPAIDGKNDDWTGATLQLEKYASVEYAFRNDAEYLYVLFVFQSSKTLSSIETTGMTLHFGPVGKKSKDHGVQFISKNVTADELIAIMEKRGGPLSDERKQQIRSGSGYVVYSAHVVDKKGKVVAAEAESLPLTPPAFRSGALGEAFVYEFRVPLARAEGQPAGINASAGQSFKVGFEWGGLTKEMRDQITSQSGFSGEGAGENPTSQDIILEEEGINTSGASGPGLSSRMAQMRRKFRKFEFWVDVTLSASK